MGEHWANPKDLPLGPIYFAGVALVAALGMDAVAAVHGYRSAVIGEGSCTIQT